jgi:hypothetical protein
LPVSTSCSRAIPPPLSSSATAPRSPSQHVAPIGQSIAWTVVSRVPYLKAVAYYPHPAQGGWFLNPQQYVIPGYVPHADDRESPEVRRVEAEAPLPSLYAARLIRAGWTMQDRRAQFRPRIVFVKPAAAGWELRHIPDRSYQLVRDDIHADTRAWEWADIDRHRLVWAAKGCLWAGLLRRDGIQQAALLLDANGMQFESIPAPYDGGRPIPPEPPPSATNNKTRRPLPRKPDRSKIRPGRDPHALPPG